MERFVGLGEQEHEQFLQGSWGKVSPGRVSSSCLPMEVNRNVFSLLPLLRISCDSDITTSCIRVTNTPSALSPKVENLSGSFEHASGNAGLSSNPSRS